MSEGSIERVNNRRSTGDRRKHSWRTVTYCGLSGRGRRREARRKGHDYYLDWYEPRLAWTAIGILLLSTLDAMLTLSLLTKGAYEGNYLMLQLLNVSNEAFIIGKTLITVVGVLFLLMHSHFHIFRITNGKRVLQILLAAYGVLIAYELTMLAVLK